MAFYSSKVIGGAMRATRRKNYKLLYLTRKEFKHTSSVSRMVSYVSIADKEMLDVRTLTHLYERVVRDCSKY